MLDLRLLTRGENAISISYERYRRDEGEAGDRLCAPRFETHLGGPRHEYDPLYRPAR